MNTIRKLVLFDIDGTLVLTGGAGIRAMNRACEELVGHPRALANIPVAGRTDRIILTDVVTAAGDVATLPSLFLATYLLGIHLLTPAIAIVSVVLAVIAAVGTLRSSGLPLMRRVVVESMPVLVLAGAVDILAGLTIDKRFDSFLGTYLARRQMM